MQKKDYLFFTIIFLILLAVFWPSLNYELVFDSKYIFENNFLFKGNFSPFAAFKHAFAEEPYQPMVKNLYYRPLTTFSFLIEKSIWGLNNFQMRLINLMLFFAILIILFLFLKVQSVNPAFPYILTSIFAFFPFNMDNIIWVIGRSDLLMIFFALLSLYFLDSFLKQKKIIYGILSCLSFTLGLLSKEAMIFILPLLLLYELIKNKKVNYIYYLSVFAVSVFFFWLKGQIIGTLSIPLTDYGGLQNNLKMMLSTLGYYLNSISMPYSYSIFIRPETTVNTLRLLSGIFFLIIMFSPAYWIYRKKDLLFPYLLSLIFIGCHLFLIFTPLSPYKASIRYLILPVLGILWIGVYFICKLKPLYRKIITLSLIFTFIPSILINSTHYRNDLYFWKHFHQLNPLNSFYADMLAEAYFKNNKFLEGEILQKNFLKTKLKRKYLVSAVIRLAYLESLRGNYKKSFELLESIKRLQKSDQAEINAAKIRIGSYLSRGNYDQAEALSEALMARYKYVKVYRLLLNLSIALNKWNEAEKIMKKFSSSFPLLTRIPVKDLKRKFQAYNPEEKILFYIKYGNFSRAVKLIKTKNPRDLKSKFRLLKLLYLNGKYREANEIVRKILQNNRNKYKTYNLVGSFYLNSLYRIKEAVQFFKQAIKINPRQPPVLKIINFYNKYY